MAAIVGVIHGSLFHLIFGHELSELSAGLGLGVVGGIVGGALGSAIPPAVLAIGEANLISTTILAWSALALGRLLRIC
ncbi:MAG TPA: hypothetical protein VGK54_03240 [Chloroflexota bacterium]